MKDHIDILFYCYSIAFIFFTISKMFAAKHVYNFDLDLCNGNGKPFMTCNSRSTILPVCRTLRDNNV